ncbi:long-chain-fatty-acid--CoA ligase [Roseiterribacter gracilis]|uniref:Dicarboxylate--CoA ligase PimA n=1 Tax=Roseiterribacter gracilis TaxID=2812848 RepID=A0A8S8XFZ3_9PROT|nr:dicarboxylate--CoA ligase PimA [Rhodospirillales bacterium TMPK1]
MQLASGQTVEYPWFKAYPADVAWNAPLQLKPMPTVLAETVERVGDHAAIDFMGKVTSYRELGALVDRAAKGLLALGVKKGTRVGLFLPNCVYAVAAYYAAMKAGATVVNSNPLYTEREVRHQVEDSGIEIMITLDVAMLHAKLVPLLGSSSIKKLVMCSMAEALPFPKSLLYPLVKHKDIARWPRDANHVAWRDLVANDGKFDAPVLDALNDIAVLQYTGGTTGTPKGAMLTHANLCANTEQASLWCGSGLQLTTRDKMLGVIPFFHVFGMTAVMNFAILRGITIVPLPRFDIKQTLETIAKKKITIFHAVPTIYTAMNNHPDRLKYDLSSIRLCISGGAPLPMEVKEQFEHGTGCSLVEGYGLSETSPIACCNPPTGRSKSGSIGLPVPQTIVEIVSLEDRTTLVACGEKGEVCISGPQVMKGYWNKPAETADVMNGARFHTGDVGYMDEDGYTFIVDRLKDIVIASGYKIYPRKVEEEIYQHPAVEECVAGGIKDAYRGETLKVWIKCREGMTLSDAELRAFLKDRLSPIEMPKLVEFRDVPLPKTLIGKLSRKALLDEEAAKSPA